MIDGCAVGDGVGDGSGVGDGVGEGDGLVVGDGVGDSPDVPAQPPTLVHAQNMITDSAIGATKPTISRQWSRLLHLLVAFFIMPVRWYYLTNWAGHSSSDRGNMNKYQFAALKSCALSALLLAGCTAGMNPPNGTPSPSVRYDGLPDKSANSFVAEYSLKTRWQKQSISYFLASFTNDLPQAEQRQAFADALAVWSTVVPLDFSEVNSAAQADMVIGFGTGDHCNLYSTAQTACPAEEGQGGAFDGASGTLAHCYFPPGSGGPSAGDCHFDDAETWADNDATPTQIRLLETAIHEIGHALGLGHSDVSAAVMFPSYMPDQRKQQLGDDDVRGIQELYGARDGAVRPAGVPRRDTPTNVPTTPSGAVALDADGDGIDGDTELFILGTDPNNPDTDFDGLLDIEVAFGLNPLNPDTDGDGALDGDEVAAGTNPLVPDLGSINAGAIAGVYCGNDSEGAPLVITVFDDGSVLGSLSVIQFGFETVVGLFGGVDGDGNILMVSFDYFFALGGTIGGGFASGESETAGGFVGSWSVAFDPVGDCGFGDGGGDGFCSDDCEFAADGECDDGRIGAITAFCLPGTDCFDCGPLTGDSGVCSDDCVFAGDGECDDGRIDADTDFCFPGTDCFDCGPLAKFAAAPKRLGAADLPNTNVYQPIPALRQPTTSPVHQRVTLP